MITTKYTAKMLSSYVGGGNLEYVGQDEDNRPVFSGYWDCGTPVIMVGEPGKWFSAYDGTPSDGSSEGNEKFEDSLYELLTIARKMCGIKTKKRK